MYSIRRSLVLALAVLTLPWLAGPVAARPFNVHDLVTMQRISDVRVSPDGTQAVFVLRTTDVEADRGRTDLWSVGVDGSNPAQWTTHEASDFNPRWAPDGGGLYFLSTRSGSSQVWFLPSGGGEARQVTDLPLDAGNLVVSPTGRHLAVTLEVFPDCDTLKCTVKRLDERENDKATGRVYDELFMRHWDVWKDGRLSRLYAIPLNEMGKAGDPVAVSAKVPGDVPSKPFGGSEEIAFTPDGTGLVFAAREGGAGEPWSTNFDLYLTPADGTGAPRNLTADNPAWDTQPVFSPDGKTLAYLAMERPGYESDRLRIVLRSWPDGEPRELAPEWDRSAGGLTFSPDGETLYVTASDVGNVSLFAVDVASGDVERLVSGGHVRSPAVAGADGNRLLFGRDTFRHPVELFTTNLEGGDERRITHVNDEALDGVELGEYEQFSFAGWNGETVHGYVVKPVGFDEGKTYPLAFLIHGGPQGSFDNDFHYRWNPQVYAGAGYAAVMIDFHGSTGYGRDFTDSIRDDWGGKPLEDLQKGLAAVVDSYPWIDGDRACALGASYGGYMINWIAGRWPNGFRCLVNHDGLFDHRMMYYTTEELWFPEWDHMGPYYANPEAHEKHNPARYVEEWKTPMLVIHGELDYRVPVTQGIATFTALQRRGIPSRFLYFPDENHWVLQPANSILWHDTVLAWLNRWLRTP